MRPTGTNGNDLSHVAEVTPQDQLTPISTSFTETFSGTMSQTIGTSGSSTTPFVGEFSGTRTTAGPLAALGSHFSGAFTGTNMYDPPVFANPGYRNVPFTATMTGRVKEFLEGGLTGTVALTISDSLSPQANTFSYTGSVTIRPDGTLNASRLIGDIFQFRGVPGVTPGTVGTSALSLTHGPGSR